MVGPLTEPLWAVAISVGALMWLAVTAGMLTVEKADRPTAWPLGALLWPLLAFIALATLVLCTLVDSIIGLAQWGITRWGESRGNSSHQ